MTKQNDYQKYFAIKRAISNKSVMFFNEEEIVDIWLHSLKVFSGVSRMEITTENNKSKVYVDIQDITII